MKHTNDAIHYFAVWRKSQSPRWRGGECNKLEIQNLEQTKDLVSIPSVAGR